MDRRPPRLPTALRVLAVGLLLVVVVVGVRALDEAPLPNRPPLPMGPLLLALGVVLAVLFIAALAILGSSLRRGGRHQRAPASVRYGRGLVVLVLVLILTLNPEPLERLLSRLRPSVSSGASSEPSTPSGAPEGGLQAVATSTLLVLVVVMVLLALLAVFSAVQHRRAMTSVPPVPPPAVNRLASLVAAGEQALAVPRDAREAIITCYLAMERELARLGTARAAAETPAELLDRAQADGLLPRQSADRLLQLFAEARFSSHPLTERDRAAAERALAELRAALQRARVHR